MSVIRISDSTSARGHALLLGYRRRNYSDKFSKCFKGRPPCCHFGLPRQWLVFFLLFTMSGRSLRTVSQTFVEPSQSYVFRTQSVANLSALMRQGLRLAERYGVVGNPTRRLLVKGEIWGLPGLLRPL
jgi:hypothetical protein